MSKWDQPETIVGYEIEVEFHVNSGKPAQTFHWVGTEAACRRKGMMKRNARRVVSATPIKARHWVNAYGDPRIKEGV